MGRFFDRLALGLSRISFAAAVINKGPKIQNYTDLTANHAHAQFTPNVGQSLAWIDL